MIDTIDVPPPSLFLSPLPSPPSLPYDHLLLTPMDVDGREAIAAGPVVVVAGLVRLMPLPLSLPTKGVSTSYTNWKYAMSIK